MTGVSHQQLASLLFFKLALYPLLLCSAQMFTAVYPNYDAKILNSAFILLFFFSIPFYYIVSLLIVHHP
jgi:hypothetical protein